MKTVFKFKSIYFRRQAYIKQEAERQLLEEITKKFEEERKKKQVQVTYIS